ncbi:MAG TPA: molybdopterin molybdotransferase MoeA [Methanobacteriaceae archaeon]|nr:molybdopterin molybdotransferase MoeA [Methanobacteriaceae archaeon]
MFLYELMPVEDAKKLLKSNLRTVGVEMADLEEVHRRVLAQDLFSLLDSPPFDRSAMDGYALQAEETFGHSVDNPVQLDIVDRLGAGNVSNVDLKEGEAIQIATGAPLPSGANAVVMEEFTQSHQDHLQVETAVIPGENVSPAGEDFKTGDMILRQGSVLNPPEVGIVASAGYREVKVYKKPAVGVMVTGSELVMPKSQLEGAEIINSNHFSVKFMVESALAVPDMTHCVDDYDLVRREFLRLLKNNDCLITTGGTAISKGDVVVDVAAELGEVLIHGVTLRPGKPFAFAVVEEKPVFMLSGFPVAAMVQFDVFVREILLGMQGFKRELHFITKNSTRKIPSTLGRTDYIRARIEGDAVRPLKIKGSGIIKSMVDSDCYIVMDENLEGVGSGEKCQVLPYHSLQV